MSNKFFINFNNKLIVFLRGILVIFSYFIFFFLFFCLLSIERLIEISKKRRREEGNLRIRRRYFRR